MIRTHVPLTAPAFALLLALLLASAATAETSVALVGSYTLSGEGPGGAYAGTASVESTAVGLRLRVQRGDAAALTAPLTREAGGYAWSVALPAGLAPGLEGEPFARRVARYRVGPGRLEGRWEDVRGELVLARGSERLERRGAVRVAVSVDWEGRELAVDDLAAMEAFRRALPDVPLTHFLNAAYLTQPGADRARLARALQRVVLAGDETGLHVHAWHSLIRASGVTFRRGPTFWNGGQIPPPPPGRDAGHEVEIAAYTVDELRAVVATSRRLLAELGYPLSGSFRAGGWIAPPHVLHAVRAEGFGVDSSATTNRWHDELRAYALHGRIAEVWSGVSATSAPYWIETPAGALLEMPDTCALADYVTADEMVDHVEQALARQAADPARDLFVHVGFHQETASRYADRVRAAIERLRREHPDAPLVFETLAASARGARDQLPRRE